MKRWILAAALSIVTSPALAAVSAGISEYFVPVDEDNGWEILHQIGTGLNATENMHSVISVTPWSDGMVIYYDHWEDGYDLDPNNPSTADETCTANRGEIKSFESSVPRPRTLANVCTGQASPSNCTIGTGGNTDYCYDGRDRILAVGGGSTVLRAGWPQTTGVVTGLAEEVYPVTPQLTTYILPFGEDIYAANNTRQDYQRVMVTVQATEDATTFQVDFDADGTFDAIDCNRDGTTDGTQCTLNRGDIYLLDNTSDGAAGSFATLDSGTIVQGSATIQLQFFNGDPDASFNSRATSAFPRGFWDNEYYAPADGATNGEDVDILLFNPHATALTINWETLTDNGTLIVPAGSYAFFQQETGSYVPDNSAVYLSASDVFWGVSDLDVNSPTRDWSYSLVPAFLLDNEQFLSWAPGCYDNSTGLGCTSTSANRDDSGIFLTVVQDNTLVFVDRDNDGTPEDTYSLNRLQTQFVYDTVDGDMTGAHIWATGNFVLAYGESMENSVAANPSLDAGYTHLPNPGNWMELALTTEKSTNPIVVGVGTNEVARYHIEVDTHSFSMDNITVTDTLATGWGYCTGANTPVAGCAAPVVTFPNGSTSADAPSIAGQVLTWGSSQFTGGQLDMAPYQNLVIEYSIYTTAAHTAGSVTTSEVKAVGSRSIGSPSVTQTFTASDSVFNLYSTSDVAITKTSNIPTVAYPGDTITYTVTVQNTGATTLTNINLFDALPNGVSYVTGSVSYPVAIADYFGSQVYNNQNDNLNGATWLTNWVETGDSGGATHGDIRVSADGTSSYVLMVRDDNNQIGRRANISTYNQAILSFDYRRNGIGSSADKYVAVEVCQNSTSPSVCSGSWVNVAHFSGGTDASYIHVEYDLNSPSILNGGANSSTFAIRFRTPTGAMNNGDTVYFDNIVIDLGGQVLAGVSPPVYVSNADGIDLRAGSELTLSYQALVDNPLASGIDEITNTASVTSTEIPLAVYASVTDPVVNPSTLSAIVGDRIWMDTNGNSSLDVGEPGLANIQLTLRDQFGTPLAVTTSDSNGYYVFTNVQPGTGYYVEVTGGLPGGITQTTDSRTDNRTNSFNLVAAQNYSTADIGYTIPAGTAMLGDLVWSDADGDGVHDAGEPGLSGVTVGLYEDTNDNGEFNYGTDVLITTTVSGANGSYAFTGVTASGTQDYFVFVDSSQPALANYTATTDVTAGFFNVASGAVLLNADFGFQPQSASYTISDRVWLDTVDGDGAVDGGESGAAGVTVALLDGSLNLIATVTTDSNGNFSFSGVPPGNYFVQVTDTAGVLTDFYGTTTRAQAGEFQIVGLSGNLDNTASPSFGYNINRSIGDTVFNDLDNDGVQDAGEPGIAGVLVELRNGVCVPGSTCLTDTSDSTGNYLFSGLSDGSYTVFIDETQSVLVGYTLTTADNNGATSGHTRDTSISGATSQLGIDYGYHAGLNRTVSGLVWDDDDQDGAVDAGEPPLAGVTIDLMQGAVVVATTTTDSSGQYSFTGLPGGNFTVRVTDTSGVLLGYSPTYELTEGTTAPFNGEESVNVSSGDVVGVNFGYWKDIPTLASVISLSASLADNGKVYVSWQTSAELGTLSFDLERFDSNSGSFVRVNSQTLPAASAIAGHAGATYSHLDEVAQSGATYSYRLVEHEVWGNTRVHGPYSVQVGGRTQSVKAPADGTFAMTPVSKPRAPVADNAKAPVDARTVFRNTALLASISASEDALVRVDFAALEQSTGMTINELFGGRPLQLTQGGQAVSWWQDTSGTLAFVQGIDSLYTKDNVYQIVAANPSLAQTGSAAPAAGAHTTQADVSLHLEEDAFAPISVTRDPESDYWYWTALLQGYAGWDVWSTGFSLNDLVSANSIELILVGGSTGLHQVEISLNGQNIGVQSWTGLSEKHVSILLASELQSGANTLELRNTGASYNLFYVDSVTLGYRRELVAEAGRIRFVAEQDGAYELAGFASNSIHLIDVTNPRAPVVLNGLEVTQGTNGYHLAFQAAAGHEYLAVATDQVASLVPMLERNPVLPSGAVDYLVISPYSLMSQAEQLVAYRAQLGLKGAAVLLDDIYNTFSFGVRDPNAIKAFLAQAAAENGVRYVTLAGSANYDYRNLLGTSDDLLPTLMTGTPQGLFACDTCLADFDGDNLPNLVLGRIPAATSDELAAYIAKLKAYEASQPLWNNLMVAGKADAAGDFPADSESLSLELPSSVQQHKIYLSSSDQETAAGDDLVARLNTGSDWMNYTGHGAENVLNSANFFTATDAATLNTVQSPLVTALSCAVNRFENLGRSIGEELVLNPNGAVAVYAPSGLSLNTPAVSMGRALIQQVYQQGEPVLGEALMSVPAVAQDVPSYLWRIYNLMGDSALHVLGTAQIENPTDVSAMPDVAVTGEGACKLASNGSWGRANSPYILNCNLTVDDAAMLTIEPGVTIKTDAGRKIIVRGNLNVAGSQEQPVRIVPNTAGSLAIISFVQEGSGVISLSGMSINTH